MKIMAEKKDGPKERFVWGLPKAAAALTERNNRGRQRPSVVPRTEGRKSV